MFVNRIEAGRRLATELEAFRGRTGVVVVGLPRGGVPVAAEVARLLDLTLDVIVVRKIGVPHQPELAMGALGDGGVRVVDEAAVRRSGVSAAALAAVEKRERAELERRSLRFRGRHQRTPLRNKTVIVVDDGIATGNTARAACTVARAEGAEHIVLAVPVAPVGWHDTLGDAADEYVAVETPSPFGAVGNFYRDFSATTDDEVVECLRAWQGPDCSA